MALAKTTDLGECSVTPLSWGSATKPDLFRLDFPGGGEPLVLKTYALKNLAVRITLGWFVTRRERRFLERLEGVKGICRLARPQNRTGVFMKWIEGTPLNRVGKGVLSPEVYHGLEKIVNVMHQADVVHLDLGHTGNILITPGGDPVLLDFQSALFVKHWPAAVRRWLQNIDHLTLLKWKKKRFPQILTPEEQAACRTRERMILFWPWSHTRGRGKRTLSPSERRNR